jgi:DNA-binding NarL/FixJ family response regulator
VGPAVIRVGVIEDHPIYRSGLVGVIEAESDLFLVGAMGSVEDFAKAHMPRCHVLLLDLHLPGLSGASAVVALRRSADAVLVLSATEAPRAVVEAMAVGAAGYVSKQAGAPEVLAAIRAVASGQTYVTATLASYLLQAPRDVTGREVTGREREVLELVAGGETDRDIADILGISIHTVHSHLDRIRQKTGRHRRGELAALASKEGIKPRGAKEG